MQAGTRMTGVLALVLALGAGLGVLSSLTNQAVSPAGRDARSRSRSRCLGAARDHQRVLRHGRRPPHEPYALSWYEMRDWSLAALAFGSVLGVVGGSIGRPGVPGLIAGLVVPIGAAVEMAWLPRWSGSEPGLAWARWIVWVAAALSAGLLVTRFLIVERRRRPA